MLLLKALQHIVGKNVSYNIKSFELNDKNVLSVFTTFAS